MSTEAPAFTAREAKTEKAKVRRLDQQLRDFGVAAPRSPVEGRPETPFVWGGPQ